MEIIKDVEDALWISTARDCISRNDVKAIVVILEDGKAIAIPDELLNIVGHGIAAHLEVIIEGMLENIDE